MSDKRKKKTAVKNRGQRRSSPAGDEGRIVDGVEIPRGAVLADPSQQVPNNSYSPPPQFYVDIEFTCRDCGQDAVWTAEQQKWYYEVAKGSLFARAILCRECRTNAKAQQNLASGRGVGDPNPFKHPAIILARLRTAIEPALSAAGFRFEGRNKPGRPIYLYLDYSRQGELFRLSWDRQDSNCFIGFTAELVPESGECKKIASDDLSYIGKLPRNAATAEIQMLIDSFVKAINAFLNSLPRVDSQEEP